jgi:COMPASS component SWD2
MVPTRGISGEEVSWTPDSKFVVGGSSDGKVHVWDLSDESKIPQLRPGDEPVALQPAVVLDGLSSATRCVKFNPRYHMMSTAGAELVGYVMKNTAPADFVFQAFWLPDNNSGDSEGRMDKGKAPEM